MIEFKEAEDIVRGLLANAPSQWTSLSGEIGDGKWFLRSDIDPITDDGSIRRIWIEAGEYGEDAGTSIDSMIVGLWDTEAEEICAIEKLVAWGIETDMKQRTAQAFHDFLMECEPVPENRQVRYVEYGDAIH